MWLPSYACSAIGILSEYLSLSGYKHNLYTLSKDVLRVNSDDMTLPYFSRKKNVECRGT